jgi:GntR family transcriptional regulator/MocR family aminotransferase
VGLLLTIQINEGSGVPIYVQVYNSIKEIVISGKLKRGTKLPSKRKFASHHNLSITTVVNAYEQLIAEGYIESKEKRGYYVCKADWVLQTKREGLGLPAQINISGKKNEYKYELNTNVVDTVNFPFSTWAKLMREVLHDEQGSLLEFGHPQGGFLLRQEISNYLQGFRNISAPPEQIVLGAGVEYLLGIIIELLNGYTFALENPCYPKLAKIFSNKQASFKWAIAGTPSFL